MRYFWWAIAINICMVLVFSPILILEYLDIKVPEYLKVICFIIFFASLIPAKKITEKIIDKYSLD